MNVAQYVPKPIFLNEFLMQHQPIGIAQIDQEVPRIARKGIRRLFVQPVSFTCEHIETLLELDIELRADAIDLDIEDFHRGEALNLNETWLDSLAGHLIDTAFSAEDGKIDPEA